MQTLGGLFSDSQRLFLHIWLLFGCIQALQIPHFSSGLLKHPGQEPQRFLLVRLVTELTCCGNGAGNCLGGSSVPGDSILVADNGVVGEGVSSAIGLCKNGGFAHELDNDKPSIFPI